MLIIYFIIILCIKIFYVLVYFILTSVLNTLYVTTTIYYLRFTKTNLNIILPYTFM